MTRGEPSVLWAWVFRVVAVLGGVPLYCARHLPFSDLPEHVAVMATLRHFWNPEYRSQELFTIEGAFRTQYWLYHLVGAVLAVPLGAPERANLVLLFLTAVGFPYALRALLRAGKMDGRLALLGVPLFWNRALAEGLLNFVASVPLCIFGLALALEQASAPTRKRSIGLAFVALAIFYVHLCAFAVFIAGALLFIVAYEIGRRAPDEPLRTRARRLLEGHVWLVPVTIAALVFALTSTVTHPDPSTQGAQASLVRFFPKLLLVYALPGWMHKIWTSPWDEIFAAVAWLGVVVTFLPMLRRAPSRPRPPEDRLRAWLVRSLLLLGLGSYFLMPAEIGYALVLNVRMATFVGLFAVALAQRCGGLRAEVAAWMVALGAVGSTVHCAYQMRMFEQQEAANIDVLLRALPRGKRMLTLAFDARSARTQIPPFLHVGGYYRARYGGIASFSFSELPHWPVRYRPEAAPPKKESVFWDYEPCLYRNTTDGPAYDYVLTRADFRPFEAKMPGPSWRVLAAAREWRLYERLPGVLVEAPEGFVDRGPCPGR